MRFDHAMQAHGMTGGLPKSFTTSPLSMTTSGSAAAFKLEVEADLDLLAGQLGVPAGDGHSVEGAVPSPHAAVLEGRWVDSAERVPGQRLAGVGGVAGADGLALERVVGAANVGQQGGLGASEQLALPRRDGPLLASQPGRGGCVQRRLGRGRGASGRCAVGRAVEPRIRHR